MKIPRVAGDLLFLQLFEDLDTAYERKLLRFSLNGVDYAEDEEDEEADAEEPADDLAYYRDQAEDDACDTDDDGSDKEYNALISVETREFRLFCGKERNKEQYPQIGEYSHHLVVGDVLFFHFGGVIRGVGELFFEGGHGLSLFLFYINARPRTARGGSAFILLRRPGVLGAILPR